MKTTLGIVGEKGGGKGTFVKILKEIAKSSEDGKPFTVTCIKSSDILAETLKLWDLPLTRSNLQQLAIIMDGKYGAGSLAHAVKQRINSALASTTDGIIIYEGIRWPSDLEIIRQFPDSKLIYITAPAKVRYERTKSRKEKVEEGEASFEQFMKEEMVATETNIPAIAAQADVKIENTGTEEELTEKILHFYRTLLI